MNKNPLISVLLPMYNVEKYIAKCLESIINQTYKDLEIIIVNDCSPDNSIKIAREYEAKDARIKIYEHSCNQKYGAARNTALNNAAGDFIIFVDSDDWLETEFVEYMLELEDKTGADVVISRNVYKKDANTVDKIEVWTPEYAAAQIFYPGINIGVWNKMWRRSFIEENKFRFIKELYTGEGLCFMATSFPYANKIGVGLKGLYHYRLNNPESATTKPDLKQPVGALHTLEVIRGKMNFQSTMINRAINFHTLINYFWIIKTIIELKLKKQENRLYKKSVRLMRKNIRDIIAADVSARNKLRIICICMAPGIMTYIINWRNRRRLNRYDD